MSTLQINELLCFLTVQFDKIDRENLISLLVDSYVFREALEAKTILISECEKASISESIKDYCTTRVKGKSGALNRVITDVVDIWTVIDKKLVGKISCQFVAANPNRLPHTNVEKCNLQFLIASIEKLHEKVDNQDKQIELLSRKACNNNNNINNNNNNKNNKRRLSGSSPSFTPKRLQTGVDTFVSSPAAAVSSPALIASLLPAPGAPPYSLSAPLIASLLPAPVTSSNIPSPTPTLSSLPVSSASSQPPAPTSDIVTTTTTAAPPLVPAASASDAAAASAAEASAAAAPAAAVPDAAASDVPAPDAASSEATAEAAAAAAALTTGSFASKANRLSRNQNWIVVERKKKKIVPVTGSGGNSTLEGVPKTKKDYWEVCCSRLKEEGTSIEKIKSHLQGQGIEVKEVFVIPSKFKGTVSAKVRVALEHKERALDANTWPNHVRISSWINKSKSARKDDAVRRQQAEV